MLSIFKSKPQPVKQEPKLDIHTSTIAKAKQKQIQLIEPYKPPRGVLPAEREGAILAMDASPYDYINQAAIQYDYYFPGYPILSSYAQLPEYRKISETIAKEMTRKWIRFTSSGDEDKADKIKQLEDAFSRFNVQAHFRDCAEMDGFFGRGQLYIDVNKPDGTLASRDPSELELPLFIHPNKITKGSLRGFVSVEPVWTYPGAYNATNPLADDYYRPSTWFVMGDTVHRTRLLNFISREVPDLLKASYNFGGLSMSQMAKPYVDHWIRTRDSVSSIIHQFNTQGIKTNMGSMLSGMDDAQFFKRVELYNAMRDNRGLMLLDKDTEEFFQYTIPLGTLDKLQAQSQEQMSSVASIPLVKLLGITPSGLNASSAGEIQVFYDSIHSLQEMIFRPNLEIVLQVVQLSEFGEIDPDIGFEFETLYGADELEASQIRLNDAQTDSTLISVGAISPDESRARVASDPNSGYNSIDDSDDDLGISDLPEEGETDLDDRNVLIQPRASENVR